MYENCTRLKFSLLFVAVQYIVVFYSVLNALKSGSIQYVYVCVCECGKTIICMVWCVINVNLRWRMKITIKHIFYCMTHLKWMFLCDVCVHTVYVSLQRTYIDEPKQKITNKSKKKTFKAKKVQQSFLSSSLNRLYSLLWPLRFLPF